jgi:hypothetical protein
MPEWASRLGEQIKAKMGEQSKAFSDYFEKDLPKLFAKFNKFTEPLQKEINRLFNNLKTNTKDGLTEFKRQWDGLPEWAGGLIDKVTAKIKEQLKVMFDYFEKDLPNLFAKIEKMVSEQIGKKIDNFFDSLNKKIKEKMPNIVETIRQGVNKIGDLINRLFKNLRSLGAAGPNMTLHVAASNAYQWADIPAAATGAYARGPSLVQIAEGGQGEYAIPESMMTRAALNYLQGARGLGVLEGTPNAPTTSRGAPQINIRISPRPSADANLQFSLDEIARVAHEVAAQTVEQMTDPAVRMALAL